MKHKIEKRALKLFNECCSLGLNSSYLSILETMYDTASEEKNYVKCSIINELIKEEINS